MNTIVDITGFFTSSNDFIPKEISIFCDENPDKIYVLFIKPPFPFEKLTCREKKSANWIKRHRQISWDEGLLQYNEYMDCMMKILKHRVIYVKGEDKANWLRHFLYFSHEDFLFHSNDEACPDCFVEYNVHDLKAYNCPSFNQLHEKYKRANKFHCKYHTRCTVSNVSYLRQWCKDNNIF